MNPRENVDTFPSSELYTIADPYPLSENIIETSSSHPAQEKTLLPLPDDIAGLEREIVKIGEHEVEFGRFFMTRGKTVYGWNKFVGIHVSMGRSFFKSNNPDIPTRLVDRLFDLVEQA